MACEHEQQKITDLEDALSLAEELCTSGVHSACASLPGIHWRLAGAKAALDRCTAANLPVTTLPPGPPLIDPCAALKQKVVELQQEIKDAQIDCADGIHGQCARIPALYRALVKAEQAVNACMSHG